MKHTLSKTFAGSRRRFLAVLALLGVPLSWPTRGATPSRLSDREALFYRAAGEDKASAGTRE
jgi:hypothetical protein